MSDEEITAEFLTCMVRCLTENPGNRIMWCRLEGKVAGVERVDMRKLEFRVRGKVLFIRGRV